MTLGKTAYKMRVEPSPRVARFPPYIPSQAWARACSLGMCPEKLDVVPVHRTALLTHTSLAVLLPQAGVVPGSSVELDSLLAAAADDMVRSHFDGPGIRHQECTSLRLCPRSIPFARRTIDIGSEGHFGANLGPGLPCRLSSRRVALERGALALGRQFVQQPELSFACIALRMVLVTASAVHGSRERIALPMRAYISDGTETEMSARNGTHPKFLYKAGSSGGLRKSSTTSCEGFHSVAHWRVALAMATRSVQALKQSGKAGSGSPESASDAGRGVVRDEGGKDVKGSGASVVEDVGAASAATEAGHSQLAVVWLHAAHTSSPYGGSWVFFFNPGGSAVRDRLKR
ncbi:hypothetical protein C8R47DRAFT_215695 [Mycena vitilis]|nr:hypothetical protein C8R47DRAFT_215695 [Mycena vitilis]